MNTHEQMIQAFYQAFQRLDWRAMAKCYHPEAIFSDPLFHQLNMQQLALMWQMLCERAQAFDLQYSSICADDHRGAATWVARYRFAVTGNKVKNTVYAEFQFKDGLIIRHSDHFNFWWWQTQALGVKGALFGWSGFMRRKVQRQALAGLARYSKHQAKLSN